MLREAPAEEGVVVSAWVGGGRGQRPGAGRRVSMVSQASYVGGKSRMIGTRILLNGP